MVGAAPFSTRAFFLLASTGKLSVMSGNVMNRAGLVLPRKHYDYVVLGGGLLGLAVAFYLRRLEPQASLLIVEQGGIPSESGATFVSPAVAHAFFEEDELRKRARWNLQTLANLSKETGVERPNDVPFRQVGMLSLERENGADTQPTQALLETFAFQQVEATKHLLELPEFPHARWDASAGYGSAEAAALHYGYGAVKEGADLLLNARAQPLNKFEIKLERLEFDRQMRHRVVKTEKITADAVIVAAGASTPALVEDALGVLLPYRRHYVQYPRIETDVRLPLDGGRVNLPVICADGFTLRPQGEGVLVVPPPLSPDPDGYEPTGARLLGVRVGVRREVLDTLLAHADALPFVNWESLNLGKTVQKVRGAWEVIPPDGVPKWRQVEGWHTLVGGRHGFSLGLAAAYDLAATLANTEARPWN